MDGLIRQFREAYAATNGEQLAETLNPDIEANSAKLQALWGRGDLRSTTSDLNFLFHQDQARFKIRLSKDETNGWFAIYIAYWKAVGEILAVQGLRGDTKVSQLEEMISMSNCPMLCRRVFPAD